MSIQGQIQALITDGRLVKFETIPKMRAHRKVYLVPDVNSRIVGPWDEESDDALGMPCVRENLENFIVKGRTTASFKRTPRTEFRRLSVKRHKRPVVWEIRTTSPGAQFRLIGLFAYANIFVGFDLLYRETIDSFGPEINRAKSNWELFFNGYKPVLSEDIHDYISENVDLLR